jgi:hypothetical protein
MKQLVSYVVQSARGLAAWLGRETWPKASHGWSRGLRKQNSWIYVVATVFLFPLLIVYAFSYSWLYGISFLTTGIVAIYYGYIFATPLMLVVTYVGVIVGAEATKLLFAAKDIALVGEILPALIVIMVAVFLTVKAQAMKTGAIVADTAATAKRRRQRPNKWSW